ncbi:MAG: hypothetical protein AAFR51_17460 [Pseudomonadota bacterium]
MERSKAIELIEIVKRFDPICDDIEMFASNLDNRVQAKSVIEGLGKVVAEIYLQLETPIYSLYPDLPNRLDDED